jgi:hypothetical protein
MKIKDVANDIVNYASVNGFSGLSLRYTEERLKELVMHWSPANDPVQGRLELPLETPESCPTFYIPDGSIVPQETPVIEMLLKKQPVPPLGDLSELEASVVQTVQTKTSRGKTKG